MNIIYWGGKMSVCIIILNYVSYELTIQTIEQLKKLSYKDFTVVVIDNASPNESDKILKDNEKKYGYLYIQTGENCGFAKGNNVGLKYAVEHGFDYSLIINNDLIIEDFQIIEKFIESCEADKKIACVGPKIVDLNNNPVYPYVNRMSFWDMTFGLKKEKKQRASKLDEKCYVYRVYGCCMFVKNEFIKEIGFFDEGTFLYCEEEILAERFLQKKYMTLYNPEIKVIHMESSTIGKNRGFKSLAKIRVMQKSLDIYLKKYRNFSFLKRTLVKLFRSFIIFVRG